MTFLIGTPTKLSISRASTNSIDIVRCCNKNSITKTPLFLQHCFILAKQRESFLNLNHDSRKTTIKRIITD